MIGNRTGRANVTESISLPYTGAPWGFKVTAVYPNGQRADAVLIQDFWGRAVRDDAVRAEFIAHRRVLRAAIADCVQQSRVEHSLGRAPAPGDLTVDDVVTVVLALSNGLAIEQYADPGTVSDNLFGRVLARL